MKEKNTVCVCAHTKENEKENMTEVYKWSLIYIDDDDAIIIMSFGNQNTLFLSSSSYIFQMSSTDSKTPNVEIKYTKLFINNEWHQATNGKTFSVINPSTGEEICQVEEGTRVCIQIFIFYFFNLTFSARYLQADVDKAVEAARKAFDVQSPWRLLEPAARGNLMRKFAELLRRDIDYLSVRF